jgi:hypothetical protein
MRLRYSIGMSERNTEGTPSEADVHAGMAALVLVLSDALLAAAVWLAAYELQSIFGRWGNFPRPTAMVVGVFAACVWIGLRSLMGLYPGHSLSPTERLRRHAYSVVGAFAAASFATVLIHLGFITSQFGPIVLVGGRVPRLLLALGFVGLLLLPPLVQGLARWGMWRLGIWGGGPVDVGPR